MIESAKRLLKLALVKRKLSQHRRRLVNAGTRLGIGYRLSEQYWGASTDARGRLVWDGVDVGAAAERFGTPMHLVNRQGLRRSYADFLDPFKACSAQVDLATSYKTNPVPEVLSTLHGCGTYAEVISHYELWLALALGVDPSRIVFNGPGKTIEALRLAVEKGIGLINLDSFHELEALDGECARRGIRQTVGLRVTTNVGWKSQFGFNIGIGQARDAVSRLIGETSLDLRAIHLHLGTGISDIATYAAGIRETFEFARQMRREFGVRFDTFDFGGGFGIPTIGSLDVWDLRAQALGLPARLAVPELAPTPADFAKVIVPLINEALQALELERAQILFEPGRAITGTNQILLLSVLHTKNRTRDHQDVIVDGGKNLSMPLGWETHEILPATRMSDDGLVHTDIYGPLCHPGDVVCKSKYLPRLDPGDVIAVMDAGAYFVPNEMNFSNPRPGIVAFDGPDLELVRRPETFEDIVGRDQNVRLRN